MSRFSRLFESLFNQGVATAGALVLAVLIARGTSATEFGYASISLGFLAVALTVSRSTVTTTQLLHGDDGATISAIRGGATAALVIGSVCTLASAAFLIATEVTQISALLALSIPVATVYDHYRLSLVQQTRTRLSAVVELFRFLTQTCPPAIFMLAVGESAFVAVLSWLVSYVLAAAISGLTLKSAPTWRDFHVLLSENRVRYINLGLESTLNSLAANSATFLSLAIVGAYASAAVRGGFTVSGGLGMAVLAVTPIATLSFVRRLKSGHSPYRLLLLWSLGVTAFGSFYGVILLLIPDSFGYQLLGDTWNVTKPVLFAFSIHVATRGLVTGVPIILRSADLTQQVLRLRLVTSILTVSSVAIGATMVGLPGIAWGLVVSQILASAWCFAAFARAFSM